MRGNSKVFKFQRIIYIKKNDVQINVQQKLSKKEKSSIKINIR